MLRKKTKKDYLVPRTVVNEVDLEGLVCTSVFKRVQVDELHNINAESEDSEYFEGTLNIEF